MGLIITLIIAGIIGWIASKIMHTDAEMGWIANVVVGIVGALLGTFLFGFISPAAPTDAGLSVASIIVGIVGSCVAIFVWQLITGRKRV